MDAIGGLDEVSRGWRTAWWTLGGVVLAAVPIGAWLALDTGAGSQIPWAQGAVFFSLGLAAGLLLGKYVSKRIVEMDGIPSRLWLYLSVPGGVAGILFAIGDASEGFETLILTSGGGFFLGIVIGSLHLMRSDPGAGPDLRPDPTADL